VVLVGVRQGDDVDFPEAAGPEIRGDGFFARVDGAAFEVAGETGEGAAAVDEKSVTGGRDDEEGVALAYVEDGEIEFAALPSGSEWVGGDDEGTGEHCDGESAAGPARSG